MFSCRCALFLYAHSCTPLRFIFGINNLQKQTHRFFKSKIKFPTCRPTASACPRRKLVVCLWCTYAMINHDLFCLKGLILPWSGLGHPAGRLQIFRGWQRADSRLCCSSSSPSSRAWQIRSNPDIVLAKPPIQFGLHRPFDWAAWRNSFAGSFICVLGLDTHTKQSKAVKDNIEEVTHISSFATYVTSVHWPSSGAAAGHCNACRLQALQNFSLHM